MEKKKKKFRNISGKEQRQEKENQGSLVSLNQYIHELVFYSCPGIN